MKQTIIIVIILYWGWVHISHVTSNNVLYKIPPSEP